MYRFVPFWHTLGSMPCVLIRVAPFSSMQPMKRVFNCMQKPINIRPVCQQCSYPKLHILHCVQLAILICPLKPISAYQFVGNAHSPVYKRLLQLSFPRVAGDPFNHTIIWPIIAKTHVKMKSMLLTKKRSNPARMGNVH